MDTIRAIIFDLDGVICFTDNYHYQAWKELADAIHRKKKNSLLQERMKVTFVYWKRCLQGIFRMK